MADLPILSPLWQGETINQYLGHFIRVIHWLKLKFRYIFSGPRLSIAFSLFAGLLPIGVRGGWLAAILAVESHAVKQQGYQNK